MSSKEVSHKEDEMFPPILETINVELYQLERYEEEDSGFNFVTDIYNSVEQIVEVFVQKTKHELPRLENRMPYVSERGISVERTSVENKQNLKSDVFREINDFIIFQGLETGGSIFGTLTFDKNSKELQGGKHMDRKIIPESLIIQFHRLGELPLTLALYIDTLRSQSELKVSDLGTTELYDLLEKDQNAILKSHYTYKELKIFRPEVLTDMTFALGLAQQASINTLHRAFTNQDALKRRAEVIGLSEPHTNRHGMFSRLLDRIIDRKK